ncbi:MAG: nucleotidyltransferase family protein [Pyrinomonadaceae bacterium]|nr:nucleotidyltransferase family protein [Pyrinomonadaceae bacterium]
MKMSGAGRQPTRSNLIAALLAGAWRANPSAAECSAEELEMVAPLLMETGAAALAWRRLRHSELASTLAAQQLHDVYRLYQLLSVIYEREVAEVFRLLRSHGVEPLMVKGWAISRHYAEREARPCGDVDLCVPEEQYELARRILQQRPNAAHHVDLHKGFAKLDDRSFEELLSRSELAELEGEPVRVLSAEDHLRVLCYHFLREGGWRALWLCDISVAVETCPATFDWDLTLSGRGAVADWIACSIELAHRLLGADVSETPASVRKAKLPDWLMPAVLREWEVRSMRRRHSTPVTRVMSYPLITLRGLRHHWPTPLEATMSTGASFSEMPRLPFQVRNLLARAATLLKRLPGALRNEH